MDERDWLRSADACAMLDVVYTPHGIDSTPEQPRKLRLYFAALCRVAWDELPPVCRTAVEFAEQVADGKVTDLLLIERMCRAGERMTEAAGDDAAERECLRQMLDLGAGPAGGDRPRRAARDGRHAWNLAWLAFLPLWTERPSHRSVPAAYHRADLVRDVHPYPFRPPEPISPYWRTADVVGLAQAMYDRRSFDHMPVLADALQEAECDNPRILEHCRSGNPHARGCWVLDAILRKG